MNKLLCIIKHEFKSIVMKKGFVIATLLGPLFIIAISVLPTYFTTKSEIKELNIKVISNNNNIVEEITPILAKSKINLIASNENKDDLVDKLQDNEFDAVLNLMLTDDYNIKNFELISMDLLDFKVGSAIEHIVGEIMISKRMVLHGYDVNEIKELTSKPSLNIKKLSKSGDEDEQDFLSVYMMGVVFTLFLYMTLLIYGQSIGRSIIQEKSSKTVEILLSSASSKQLMFGKIIGQGAASLVQYAVWIGLSSIVMKIINKAELIGNLPQFSSSLVLYLLIFYILGFFLYASLYAAIGAAAEDEQNLGQLSYPIIIFLIIPMIGLSYFIANVNSTITIAFSIFPLTAPILMFLRIVIANPPFIQILASIVVLILSIFIVTIFSAKIFRTGILMTGKKFSFKDMIQWLKQ